MEALKRAKQSSTPELVASLETVVQAAPVEKPSSEKTILDYIDAMLNNHTEAINKNIDLRFADTREIISNLETEVRTTNADLAAKVTILESKTEKAFADIEERFLHIENTMTQQNLILKKEVETLTHYNNLLSSNVNDLMQEKLNTCKRLHD